MYMCDKWHVIYVFIHIFMIICIYNYKIVIWMYVIYTLQSLSRS